eukprot:scaffold8956_cov31-Phaeocystis_antarctica.AAC.2
MMISYRANASPGLMISYRGPASLLASPDALYEYRKGKAIVFGSHFLHGTEPGCSHEAGGNPNPNPNPNHELKPKP